MVISYIEGEKSMQGPNTYLYHLEITVKIQVSRRISKLSIKIISMEYWYKMYTMGAAFINHARRANVDFYKSELKTKRG